MVLGMNRHGPILTRTIERCLNRIGVAECLRQLLPLQ